MTAIFAFFFLSCNIRKSESDKWVGCFFVLTDIGGDPPHVDHRLKTKPIILDVQAYDSVHQVKSFQTFDE